MAETISGYHNTLQTLTPTNPVVTITGTIKAGGAIPAPSSDYGLSHSFGAVYGPQSANFTITNLGLIDDTNTAAPLVGASAGIVLGGTGEVFNSGTILANAGKGVGIYLYRGGTVVNSGSIITQAQGIFAGPPTLAGGQDFIENTGFIDATTKPFTISGSSFVGDAAAIFQIGAGTLGNAAGGIIDAKYGLGIDLFAIVENFVTDSETATSGMMINAGTINAAYGANFYGLGNFSNSGKIFSSKLGVSISKANTVTNTGSIIGGNAGIIAYAATSISNSGSIAATNTIAFTTSSYQGLHTLFPGGVILLEGGQLSNAATGIITGEVGILLDSTSSITSAITNSGKIIAVDYGIAVENVSTTSGTTTIHGGPVTITNAGLIEATARFFRTESGGTGGSVGILMESGGEIINQAGGSIIGYNGIGAVLTIATVNNAGFIGGQGTYSAVYMYNGGVVTNSGTIVAQAEANKAPDAETGINLHLTGNVTNASTGLITGPQGVYFAGTGSFSNAGTVLAEFIGFGASGSASISNSGQIKTSTETFTYLSQSYFSAGVELTAGGKITNTGTILGGGTGIIAYGPSTITNSGSIAGTGTTLATAKNHIGGTFSLEPSGIVLEKGGSITNSTTGIIKGFAGYGIDLPLGGTVANAGQIIGTDAGIFARGTALVSNSGTISATGTTFVSNGTTLGAGAVELLAGGTINNLTGGKIIALEIGIAGTSSSGIGTTLTNSGLIEVTGTTIMKAGTIGFPPIAVDLAAGGTVSNSLTGTIIGGGIGILLANKVASGMSVLNSGVVTGDNSIFVNGTNTYASSGITMLDGGLVSNTATGKVTGAEVGVVFAPNSLKAAATLLNAGLIEATGGTINNDGTLTQPTALILTDGGAVTNQSTGIISGFNGIIIVAGTSGVDGYIDNLGTVTGTGNIGITADPLTSVTNSGHITGNFYGLFVGGSGLVSNLAGGTITGTHAGILAANPSSTLALAATIVNTGKITAGDTTFMQNGVADYEFGAELIEGGTFSNAVTGLVSAYAGILEEGSATLINAGTITGLGGLAVDLAGTNDRLVDDPGAVFNGTVYDATNTGILELAAGSKAGTIAALNSQFTGFATVTGDTGASWDFAGTIATLLNNGAITVTGSTGITLSSLANTGSIVAASGNAITGTAGARATNQGLISGNTSAGLVFNAGGTLTNSGRITGASAGFGAFGEAFLTNSGTISASGTNLIVNNLTLGAAAVAFGDGGVVNNLAGGKIIALEIGISGTSASGIGTTIYNSGLIDVTGTTTAKAGTLTFSPIAIDLGIGIGGGTISNSSTGTIIGGGIGILLANTIAAGMTVLNSGLITASNTVFISPTNTYGSTGITLLDGGLVSNATSGTVSAAEAGIVFVANTLKAAGTLINAGLIRETGGTFSNHGTIVQPTALVMVDGGTITNQSTGIISGFNAIVTTGTSGVQSLIDNLGTVTGTGNLGIALDPLSSLTNSGQITGQIYGLFVGGSSPVSNLAGGTITGPHAGILASSTSSLAATIVNAGKITAGDATFVLNGAVDFDWGAILLEGGTFSNAATGIVSAYAGVIEEGSATLINAGTIIGLGGIAVDLGGTNDKIIDDPGAVFSGVVYDATNTGIVELATGSKAGTIAAFSSQFAGFTTVDVDTGASWALGGTIATLLNNGSLAITSGSSLFVSTSLSTASTGIFLLSGNAQLEIASILGTTSKIQFLTASPGGTLAIDNAADFGVNVGKTTYAGPLLEDFKAGDVIDLKNIAATGLKLNYNATTGDLQISNSSGGIVASLQFQNASLGTGTFQSATDLVHGTLITLS